MSGNKIVAAVCAASALVAGVIGGSAGYVIGGKDHETARVADLTALLRTNTAHYADANPEGHEAYKVELERQRDHLHDLLTTNKAYRDALVGTDTGAAARAQVSETTKVLKD